MISANFLLPEVSLFAVFLYVFKNLLLTAIQAHADKVPPAFLISTTNTPNNHGIAIFSRYLRYFSAPKTSYVE